MLYLDLCTTSHREKLQRGRHWPLGTQRVISLPWLENQHLFKLAESINQQDGRTLCP